MMSVIQQSVSAAAFVALLMGYSPPAPAQDMPRTVFGNAGDYYTNLLFGDLHWTVGEVAVSRFQNGVSLSEGFHQMYYELVVETREAASRDWAVRVFPNPTASHIQANWASDAPVQARLMAATGQELLREDRFQKGQQLDLTGLPPGAYFLQLRNPDGQQGTFRILKVRR
jgi:hypothetical protein